MRHMISIITLFLLITGCQDEYFFHKFENPEIEKSAIRQEFPDEILLPTGFQPEGIAIGTNQTFYVGSLTNGQIYKGNLRTGAGKPLTTVTGPDQTVGLSFDKRSGYLYAAKGFSGMGAVYNSETGELVQVLPMADPMTNLINDVVVTSKAVFFTGSLAPIIYKVPLLKNGELPNPAIAIPIPLSGDFSMNPNPMIPQLGAFSNGIDATPNGKHLILANTGRGELYRVNPWTGLADLIDIPDVIFPFADGILLDGEILYVVQNMLNQVAVVKLSNEFLSGELITTINSTKFGIPTTVAEFGDKLYLVNGHFDIAPPTGIFPDVEFEVVKVPKYE